MRLELASAEAEARDNLQNLHCSLWTGSPRCSTVWAKPVANWPISLNRSTSISTSPYLSVRHQNAVIVDNERSVVNVIPSFLYRSPAAINVVATANSARPAHRPRLAAAGASFHSPVRTPDRFAVMIMKIWNSAQPTEVPSVPRVH